MMITKLIEANLIAAPPGQGVLIQGKIGWFS